MYTKITFLVLCKHDVDYTTHERTPALFVTLRIYVHTYTHTYAVCACARALFSHQLPNRIARNIREEQERARRVLWSTTAIP